MVVIYVIVSLVLGFWLGWVVGKSKAEVNEFIESQKNKKVDGKMKVLEFVRSTGKVTNSDVEAMLGVSDSSAERYLNELEKEGYIVQEGDTGRGVEYSVRNK